MSSSARALTCHVAVLDLPVAGLTAANSTVRVGVRVRFCELMTGFTVRFARSVVRPITYTVQAVSTTRIPAEVTDVVVPWVIVPMTAFKTFRTRANECSQDETVYAPPFTRSHGSLREANVQMPFAVHDGLQVALPSHAPYASVVADDVQALVSRSGLPNFFSHAWYNTASRSDNPCEVRHF